MIEEVLPCPFCGGTNINTYDLYGTKWMVMCEAGCCGRSGLTEEEAIKAWNKRYDHGVDVNKKDNCPEIPDGWISVDDRLPNPDVEVEVWDGENHDVALRWDDDSWWHQYMEYRIEAPTHWRELRPPEVF